jgi:hypothetical protein
MASSAPLSESLSVFSEIGTNIPSADFSGNFSPVPTPERLASGSWSADEDTRLLAAIQQLGRGSNVALAAAVRTRNPTQVAGRFRTKAFQALLAASAPTSSPTPTDVLMPDGAPGPSPTVPFQPMSVSSPASPAELPMRIPASPVPATPDSPPSRPVAAPDTLRRVRRTSTVTRSPPLPPASNSGRWSSSEDARLAAAVRDLGMGDNAALSRQVGSRTALQCSDRLRSTAFRTRFADPLPARLPTVLGTRRGPWVPAEYSRLLEGLNSQTGRYDVNRLTTAVQTRAYRQVAEQMERLITSRRLTRDSTGRYIIRGTTGRPRRSVDPDSDSDSSPSPTSPVRPPMVYRMFPPPFPTSYTRSTRARTQAASSVFSSGSLAMRDPSVADSVHHRPASAPLDPSGLPEGL